MALQSSGEIKMSQINTELGRTSNATISLDDAESGVYATINTASSSYPNNARPAAISEWYSYDHSAASGYSARISPQSTGSSAEACEALSVSDSVFKDGSSSTPVSTDRLYEDSSLSSDLVPSQGFGAWYKYEDVDGGNVFYAVYLLEGSNGECYIESVSAC